MRVIIILFVLIALAVPVLPMSGFQAETTGASASDSEKPLPAMKLQDFDGKTISSDQFKGKIIVLDFWATWCGPCIAEIPSLNRLQEKYASKGVKVVGVALASGEADEVKPFVGKNKMKYTVLMGDDEQVYDLNVVAFPTTYLVTRDMKVYRKYLGAGPRKEAELEADIQKLLSRAE